MEALAVVPPYDTPENLKELNHAIDDLHLKGIQLSAHYDDGYLDEPAYRGFLKYVAKKQIPVYVHHTPVPVEYESMM
jgi:predicted TIM-barrel fold metal-dependent hydrolase